ncbi:MAG: dockerin type I domain-containing protein [Minisyncoccia bacterium]
MYQYFYSKNLLIVFFPLALFFLVPHLAQAATCTASNGNWSAIGTWSCGHVPLAVDDVVIPNTNGLNVIVDTTAVASSTTFTGGNRANAINISGTNSLTVTNAVRINAPTGNVTKGITVGTGTLTAGSIYITSGSAGGRISQISVSTGTINCSGNITFAGTASAARITFTGAGILNIDGANGIGPGGTFTAGNSTVNFNSASAQIIGPYNYYKLTTSGGNTKTTSAAMTVSNNLNIGSGTNFVTGVTNTWTLSVTGTTTIAGTLTLANTGNKTFSNDVILNSGSVWNETGNASITINGNIVNNATTFTANAGSHTFSGSNKTFSGSTPISIPGTVIFAGGAYTNNGTFSAITLTTMTAGAVFTNNGTTTVSTALSGNGGFTQGSTGVLNFASTTIAITTFSANVPSNTVNYNANAPQTVRATTYNNLTLSGGGVKTLTGVTTIGGNFTLTGSSTATASSGLTIGGNVSIGTGTTFNGGTALDHNVAGNWSNSGTFTPSTCTVNFNGANQSINNANTWYNLSITGTSSRTVTLQSGALQTVLNGLTLSGASEQLLTLVPSISLTKWQLSAPIIQSVTYTSPSYSDASSGTAVNATSTTNSDGGNNVNWNFASNPVPTIVSISPTSKYVGDAEFTLTVYGSNFLASSTVKINGNDRTTTYYSSSTILTAIIPSSDLLSSTTLIVTVYNPTPGGGESNSQNLYVSPVPLIPTKIVIASATDGTIDSPSLVTIEVRNVDDLLVSSFQEDVTLQASGLATGDGLINIISGIGTTTISDENIETVSLSLEDTEGTGLNVSSTDSIDFGPGNSATLNIVSSSTEMVAGTLLPVTVSREDRLGNMVTTGSETFYLYSNSLSPAHKFYNAASGGDIVTTIIIPDGTSTATTWYYDDKVGTPGIEISDSDIAPDGNTGIDDAIQEVTVTSAPASTLFISNPGDLIAGERLGYEISRQDQFGNESDNGTLPVYLYHSGIATSTIFYNASTSGDQITSLTMTPGVSSSSFWLYGEKAESISVTVSDNDDSPDGSNGVNDATDNLSISPGSVAILALNNPGDMEVNTRIGYTATRLDIYNNLVTTGDLDVYLYHDATGTSTVFYNSAVDGSEIDYLTISGGVSANNFWLYSNDVGNYNITVSDNSSTPDGPIGIIDITEEIYVSPLPIVPTKFVIVALLSAEVGSTTSIIVEARDDSNNIAGTYNSSVTLHTSGDATPGGIVNIVNGVGSINIIDTKAEIVNLTLEDTASTTLDVSATENINFLAGPVYKYIVLGPGTAEAGEIVNYSISREDQYDNDVTTGVSTIYLYSNAPVGTTNYYNAPSEGSQITSASILDGLTSTDVWFSGTKAGSWAVEISDNNILPDGGAGVVDGTSTIIISSANVSRLELNDPGDMTAGTRLGYTATRFDTYNNEVTSGTDNYYLYSNANSTSTLFYSEATGDSTMENLIFSDGASTADFWYYETKPGTWTVYISDNSSNPDGSNGIVDGEDAVIVSNAPIVANKFIIVVSNTSAQIGTPITVTIRAVDSDENIDTTYQNDITLVTSGTATGGGFIDITNGVGSTQVNDLTAENILLSLLDTQNTGLNSSSTQSIVFSSTPVSHRGGSSSGTITPSVIFTGRAFPQANMKVIAIKDGQVPVSNPSAGSNSGNFNINYNGELPSDVDSFALVVYDKDNNIAQTKIFKLGVNDSLVGNVFMAPTVNLLQKNVTRGSFMGITGYAMPNYKILLTVDNVLATETTTADTDGNYKLTFNTFRLDLGEHTLKVRQIDNAGRFSDNSIEKTFNVVKLYSPKADINNDGKVNSTDLSIFIGLYNLKNEVDKKSLDLNDDGFVNSVDLSLLLGALKK